jgi:uridine kinase
MKTAFLVGIAGGTASGKSTLCEKLENSLADLKTKSLHMDAYYKPKDERPLMEAFVNGKKYTDDNHPLTVDMDKLKAAIKESRHSEYDVVIVEGLLTLWDNDIYSMLDLKLFIDCEADERMVRRINRNMERGLSMDEITDFYLDAVRFRHNEFVEPSKWRSDLIINGSRASEISLMVITEYIRNNYKKLDNVDNTVLIQSKGHQ